MIRMALVHFCALFSSAASTLGHLGGLQPSSLCFGLHGRPRQEALDMLIIPQQRSLGIFSHTRSKDFGASSGSEPVAVPEHQLGQSRVPAQVWEHVPEQQVPEPLHKFRRGTGSGADF